jgi:ABC-type glycerol-3-phosphate transport system permease component
MAKKIVLYTILVFLAICMFLPFYLMFVMATRSTQEIFSYPPKLWFGGNVIQNYRFMISRINLARGFLNSSIISVCNTLLVLFFCSLGGYAFAVYKFPFKKQLFALLLFTMMVPWTAGIIPWFIMMSKFGWLNSFKALIIPNAAHAFGVFWMRQYCRKNVPSSLLDAARIDGCSEITIFFRVIAPIILPAYASLGIMQFVTVWNDFVQPLLILRMPAQQTLPVLLKSMIIERGTDYGAVMLASTITVLPLLLVFLFASKYFLSGLTAGAVKE